MAFTDHSDLFAAVHENGINATIGQLMLQRPSMFNYATIIFTQALSSQFCLPINVPPGGLAPGQLLFTVEPQLPVPGAPRPLGLDWCLQLTNVSVDLYPGNTLVLPPELDPKHCQQVHTALGVDDTKPQWRVFCDPQTIDLDPFDFADTVGDLFEQALTDAVDALLPHGPVHDLILAVIGSVADLLRTLLDIPDDISEWLSDLFNVSFGVFNLILGFVADFFGKCVSFFQLDDPFPMFPKTDDLAEVTVPIEHLTATVSDVELVVTADIGAVS
jgi:hypothetical protein